MHDVWLIIPSIVARRASERKRPTSLGTLADQAGYIQFTVLRGLIDGKIGIRKSLENISLIKV